MPVDPGKAAALYLEAASRARMPGLAPREGQAGGEFASLVKEAVAAASEAVRQSEGTSLKAIAGEADLTEVVAAVSNAELTLRTVIAVRDRVIQAYQEILRMPI